MKKLFALLLALAVLFPMLPCKALADGLFDVKGKQSVREPDTAAASSESQALQCTAEPEPGPDVRAIEGTYENLKYSIENDEVTITGYVNEPTGALTIPETIEGYPVTGIGNHAFYDCDSLTSVEMPNVQTIGNHAFYDCDSLTSVEMLDVETIGDWAFEYCTSLTSVEMPNVQTIGGWAFSYTALTSVELPNVQTIGDYAFYKCNSLTRVEMPSVKTVGGSAFYYCKSLTSVEMPNVQTIGEEAFYYCKSLTSVEMPNVETIGNAAFYFCTSLTSVKMPNVETIGGRAFNYCESLTSVEMPNVETIGGRAFYYCESLTSVEMPNVQTIHDEAFYFCTSLTSVGMPNVQTIDYKAFSDCPKLTSFIISSDNANYSADGGILYNKDKTTLYIYPSAAGDIKIADSVQTIGDYAFYYCDSLTSAEMPNVKTIGDWAFEYCTSLTSVEMPNVQTIGSSAFSNTSLTSVEMPNVQTIQDEAFYYCKSLTSVEMPNVKTIGDDAFSRTALTSVEMPNVQTIGGWAFAYCYSLASAYFYSDAPTSFGTKVFYKCASDFTIYYAKGTSGWTTPTWNGYPTQEFEAEERSMISVGASVDSLNEDVTIKLDKETKLLSIVKSGVYTVNDLNIEFSSQGLVELISVTEGHDEYIPDVNNGETCATIVLKGLKEGETLMEVSTPDNALECINLKIESDYFDENIFIANHWTTNKIAKTTIDDFVNDTYCDPSDLIFRGLATDEGFMAAVRAWETANLFQNPFYVGETAIEIKHFYEAIFLSLLEAEYDSDLLGDYLSDSTIKYTLKVNNEFANMIKSVKGLDYYNELCSSTLTQSRKDEITNIINSWDSTGMTEIFGIISEALSKANDIDELCSFCGRYLALENVSTATIMCLKNMRDNCGSNFAMKSALDEVIEACESEWGKYMATVIHSTETLAQWCMSDILGEMYRSLLASNAVTTVISAAIGIGQTLGNCMFSTDKTISQFYKLGCLCNVRALIKDNCNVFMDAFITDRTTENAKVYIAAVNMLLDSYKLSCEYAKEYSMILGDATMSRIFAKNREEQIDFQNLLDNVSCEVEIQKTFLNRYWCYYLNNEELYEKYLNLYGLVSSNDFGHCVAVLSQTVYIENGEQCCPGVLVSINNKELKKDIDYVVSYTNNTSAGTASCIIQGIGEYSGTKTVNYTIMERATTQKATIASFNTKSANDIMITVKSGDSVVAEIHSDEIIKADIPVFVDDDGYEIYMYDDCTIYVSSTAAFICNYTKYDSDYAEVRNLSYIGGSQNDDSAFIFDTSTGEAQLGNESLAAVYDSSEPAESSHVINCTNCVSAKGTAHSGEMVSIAPITGSISYFVEWSANVQIFKSGSGYYFIMPDYDVEIKATLSYTVTYLDGITGEVISTATVEHGTDAVFPTPPEHDGYTFTGWDSDGKNITSDTVITALYEESTSVILGDVNGDGVINGKDVTLIRRYITGGYDVEVILEAADINGDGVINGKDITLLRRLIVGGYGDVA